MSTDKLSKTFYGVDYDKKISNFKFEIQRKQEELGMDLRSGYMIVPKSNGEIVFQPDEDTDGEIVEVVRGVFHKIFGHNK